MRSVRVACARLWMEEAWHLSKLAFRFDFESTVVDNIDEDEEEESRRVGIRQHTVTCTSMCMSTQQLLPMFESILVSYQVT